MSPESVLTQLELSVSYMTTLLGFAGDEPSILVISPSFTFASAVAGTLVRTMDSDKPAVTAALNTRFLSI